MVKNLTIRLLTFPPRLLDICSIVLISASINIATSAPSSNYGVETLLAGAGLLFSGVTLTLWRYAAESVWEVAQLRSEQEMQRFKRALEEQLLLPEHAPRQRSFLRVEAAEEAMAASKLPARLTVTALVSIVLCVVVAAYWFRPVLTQRQSQASAINQVSQEIKQVRESLRLQHQELGKLGGQDFGIQQRLQTIDNHLGELNNAVHQISLEVARLARSQGGAKANESRSPQSVKTLGSASQPVPNN